MKTNYEMLGCADVMSNMADKIQYIVKNMKTFSELARMEAKMHRFPYLQHDAATKNLAEIENMLYEYRKALETYIYLYKKENEQ